MASTARNVSCPLHPRTSRLIFNAPLILAREPVTPFTWPEGSSSHCSNRLANCDPTSEIVAPGSKSAM